MGWDRRDTSHRETKNVYSTVDEGASQKRSEENLRSGENPQWKIQYKD